MGSETPVRNQFGTIIGLRPKEDVDPVQTTLDAALKAVGAEPQAEPTPKTSDEAPTPLRPSRRLIASGIAVLSIGILTILLFSGRSAAPQRTPIGVQPTVTVLATVSPTAMQSVAPQASPHEVTLAPITLYGDYDEATEIGAAPDGLTCTITGQSPNGLWVWLSCPTPTKMVWAKVTDLELTADQRSVLLDSRIVSRIVPTEPAFSPPSAPNTGSSLAFCADRSSIWGNTHQCASTQAAADALADGEIGRINATAEALQQKR